MTTTTMMMAQRQRLLQHMSEHVTKFLAPQDDSGSYRQLVNDNVNCLPDHKPNTRLHTLGIFFAHMIALKKVSDYTAASAAAASDPGMAANSSSAAAAASDPGMAANSSSAAVASDPDSWPDLFADEDSSGYFDCYDPRSEKVVRVIVPSSSSNTAATAAGLKTTGLEEVIADNGAKVGDDATAVSLLSLDSLVETAVKSIDEGEISPRLSKYM